MNDFVAQKMMSQVDPAELQLVQVLAGGLAEVERAQSAALRELADAGELDLEIDVPDPEDRKQVLLDGIEAAADGRTLEWWLGERHGLDNPGDAAAYVDLDSPDWNDQISEWARWYRQQGYGDGASDSDLAAMHVRQQFGVDLDTFEREVVNGSKQAIARELLAGNLETVEFGIRDAAEQLAERDSID